MKFLIVDLEATCWKTGSVPSKMETIEIGAVMLESENGPSTAEFTRFVRPLTNPVLSEFCVQLTSIGQSDVDAAETFPTVLQALETWASPAQPLTWCSWGAYDFKQLRSDCRRHGIGFPDWLRRHVNLKQEFATLTDGKPRTMKEALRAMSFPLQGRHHRGIDDARNIARLAAWILPRVAPQVRCGSRAQQP